MAGFDPKKNLIVNFLPSSYTQLDFQNLFTKIGKISSCKLMRDKNTGETLSYGFVCFKDEKSAAKAITEVDGMVIDDKTLKVKYAKPDNPDEKHNNVYIAGLPSWVTENILTTLFTSFGKVISLKILANPNGTSRGAAMVRFSTHSEAIDAIEEMDQRVLPEARGPLRVELALSRASKQERNSAGDDNMDYDEYGLDIYDAMDAYETQQTPKIAVAEALADIGIYNLDPKWLKATVYVFGLPGTASDLTLYELFNPFGGVLSVSVIRHMEREGQPCKGYGFVNYVKTEDAIRAVQAMNDVVFEDKTLQVSLKKDKQPGLV